MKVNQRFTLNMIFHLECGPNIIHYRCIEGGDSPSSHTPVLHNPVFLNEQPQQQQQQQDFKELPLYLQQISNIGKQEYQVIYLIKFLIFLISKNLGT